VTSVRSLLFVAILLAIPALSVSAQVRPVPIARRDTVRPRPDSLGRDTTKRDSTASKELIKWNEPDSVMKALMVRSGYTATRYQGDQVVYDARTRTLHLIGKKAGVSRDQTVLVGDSINFNDSTKVIVAQGDTVILRDPTHQSADVVARGVMEYNVETHRGLVTDVCTSVEQGQNWIVCGNRAAFVSDTTRGRETAFYARNASITSCDDSIPDYHFQA
jgi:lipopolysaccharide assembly outer membrane protein LptD (OstA)